MAVSTTLGLPRLALVLQNLPTKAGDLRDAALIAELGRCPGGGHSNTFQQRILHAWRIPWTEEPDGLHSMGLKRVAHY